jgi:hypothetical protein
MPRTRSIRTVVFLLALVLTILAGSAYLGAFEVAAEQTHGAAYGLPMTGMPAWGEHDPRAHRHQHARHVAGGHTHHPHGPEARHPAPASGASHPGHEHGHGHGHGHEKEGEHEPDHDHEGQDDTEKEDETDPGDDHEH